MKNRAVSSWLRIICPIAVYQVFYMLIRVVLQHFAGFPHAAAAAVAVLCLSIPVFLVYCLRWCRECAEANTEHQGFSGMFPIWLLAGTAMAAASMGVSGTVPEESLLVFFGTCLCGPAAEEVLYRAQFIGRGEKDLGADWVLLASTVLFAAGHLGTDSFLLAIPAGVLLGELYLQERSLISVTVAHITANTVVFFFAKTTDAGWVLLLAAVSVQFTIAYLLRRMRALRQRRG